MVKVVHIESGLGNQMLSYCEYLALKKSNPEEECYLETIVYDIPECNNVICQWNGYELNDIFGIEAPNIREIISDRDWKGIKEIIINSRFWERNWNYPVWFTRAFVQNGLSIRNIRGNFEDEDFIKKTSSKPIGIKSRLSNSFVAYKIKKIIKRVRSKHYIRKVNEQDILFLKSSENLFTGQRLSFKYKGNGIELIDKEIRESFVFPPIVDRKNSEMFSFIKESNSVAIHARRGDMLSFNAKLYKYGYFKKAVNYIKKNVENPTFIFFCDPGSVDWCKENGEIFGLDFEKDKVYFTDWNKGKESFRDMQLMSYCKHAIITNSSFGWWGAYLNNNPNKITCSPEIEINTTHHF